MTSSVLTRIQSFVVDILIEIWAVSNGKEYWYVVTNSMQSFVVKDSRLITFNNNKFKLLSLINSTKF